MRRATTLLLRLLCSLVLVVALWPARASAASCPPQPACGMACCTKAKAKACAVPRGWAKRGCPCEARSAVPTAPVSPSALLTLPEWHALEASAPDLPLASNEAIVTAPGLFGVDAGPPYETPRHSKASRAPPVVRA